MNDARARGFFLTMTNERNYSTNHELIKCRLVFFLGILSTFSPRYQLQTTKTDEKKTITMNIECTEWSESGMEMKGGRGEQQNISL